MLRQREQEEAERRVEPEKTFDQGNRVCLTMTYLFYELIN